MAVAAVSLTNIFSAAIRAPFTAAHIAEVVVALVDPG
jgi:hypothetical protein